MNHRISGSIRTHAVKFHKLHSGIESMKWFFFYFSIKSQIIVTKNDLSERSVSLARRDFEQFSHVFNYIPGITAQDRQDIWKNPQKPKISNQKRTSQKLETWNLQPLFKNNTSDHSSPSFSSSAHQNHTTSALLNIIKSYSS